MQHHGSHGCTFGIFNFYSCTALIPTFSAPSLIFPMEYFEKTFKNPARGALIFHQSDRLRIKCLQALEPISLLIEWRWKFWFSVEMHTQGYHFIPSYHVQCTQNISHRNFHSSISRYRVTNTISSRFFHFSSCVCILFINVYLRISKYIKCFWQQYNLILYWYFVAKCRTLHIESELFSSTSRTLIYSMAIALISIFIQSAWLFSSFSSRKKMRWKIFGSQVIWVVSISFIMLFSRSFKCLN